MLQGSILLVCTGKDRGTKGYGMTIWGAQLLTRAEEERPGIMEIGNAEEMWCGAYVLYSAVLHAIGWMDYFAAVYLHIRDVCGDEREYVASGWC